MGNYSVLPPGIDPQQLQQSTDAISAPNVAQMQVQNPQQPQVPVAHPGMVKQFLTNYFGNVAANLTGVPNSYQRQRQEVTDQNATMQAKSKAALEQAQGRYYDARNDTAENVANTKVSGVLAGVNQHMADSGYELVPDGKGGVVQQAIPLERLSEKAKASLGLEQSKQALNAAAAELDKANADVKMNPNNPTFVQRQKEIEAKLALAKQDILLRLMNNNRAQVQFGINNGVMPDGSTPTVVGSGQMTGDNGAPIGKNFQNINGPTAATRGAADQGRAILDAGKNLKAQIDANRDKMGNMDAILNTAFLGTPASDPASSKLAASIASFAALNPRLHGFRGSQALSEFKKLLGNNINNPDSVKAAIDGISETAGSVIKAGTVHTNANTSGAKGRPKVSIDASGKITIE